MRSHTKSTAAALFTLSLALAGCAGDPERSADAQAVADTINVVFHHGKWRQIPATPENHVETIIFEQRVPFTEAAPSLDRGGWAAIERFLQEAAPASGSLISLSAAGDLGGPASLDRLALQRLEAVRVALADRGYTSALANSESGRVPALDSGEIGLTLAKAMAVLPDCDQPQPLEPSTPDFVGGFGCSTTNNLGVMVANPADLERGRPTEPADGEAASLSVQRYRVGEPKPLLEEETKSQ
ncbi:MAG: CpaD family pilus assembly lipoprotein [Kiloniellaceae bacterium]